MIRDQYRIPQLQSVVFDPAILRSFEEASTSLKNVDTEPTNAEILAIQRELLGNV